MGCQECTARTFAPAWIEARTFSVPTCAIYKGSENVVAGPGNTILTLAANTLRPSHTISARAARSPVPARQLDCNIGVLQWDPKTTWIGRHRSRIQDMPCFLNDARRGLIDRLDDARDLGRVFRIHFNADLVGISGEIGIFHGLLKRLSQDSQSIRRDSRRRYNRPRYLLSTKDQRQDFTLAIGGGEVDDNRHVLQLGMTLHAELYQNVNRLARNPIAFTRAD